MPIQTFTRPCGPILPPSSEIVLTQKHSYELVRTVMTATISHVLWARRVFPDVTYDLRSYDASDPDVSYDAFVKGSKRKPITFEPTEGLLIWKILPRSQNAAVDKILNCLEVGAADALKRGYLSKLQVSFHSMDDSSASEMNLIESYTMMFDYGNGSDITVSSELGANSVVVRNTKQDLYKLVNDVSFLIHSNNQHRSTDKQLPANFRMLMSLKYNDETPAGYQPPLFRAGDVNTTDLFSLSEPDENLTMRTGFHSVSVGVHIPNDNQISTKDPLSKKLISKVVKRGKKLILRLKVTWPSSRKELHTQPEAVKQLQEIGITRDLNSDTQDTRILRRVSSPHREATIQNLECHIPKSEQLLYTQSVLDRIKLAHTHSKDSSTEQLLKCECSYLVVDEALFICTICRSSKHARCYGFLEENEPAADIVCYTCLFEEDDPERIEMVMKPLCIKRRALYYVRKKESLAHLDEMCAHLEMSKGTVTKLLSDFKREGLVKSHRKIRGSPILTYLGNEEKLRRLYFRPQQAINHFLTLPKSSLPDRTENSTGKRNLHMVLGEAIKSYGVPHLNTPKRSQPNLNDDFILSCSPDASLTSLPRTGCSRKLGIDITSPSQLFHNTMYLTGSSTQGTPSLQNLRRPSSPPKQSMRDARHDEQHDPGFKSQNISNKKHTPDLETDDGTRKRARTGNVSPWVIQRKA